MIRQHPDAKGLSPVINDPEIIARRNARIPLLEQQREQLRQADELERRPPQMPCLRCPFFNSELSPGEEIH